MKAVVLLWSAGFILGGMGAWVVSRSAGWFGFFYLYFGLTNEKHLPHWQVSVLYGLIQLVVGLSILFPRSSGWPLIFNPLKDLFHRLYHGRLFSAVVPDSKPGDMAIGQHSGYYQSD